MKLRMNGAPGVIPPSRAEGGAPERGPGVGVGSGGGEEDGFDHLFDAGGHLFGGDAVGGFVPAAGGAEDGPGGGGGEEFGVGAGDGLVAVGSLAEDVFDDGDDGALEGHFDEVGGTAGAFGEVVEDAEGDGAEGGVAVGEGEAAAGDERAETGGGHGLEQGVLVGVVEVEGGAVEGGLVGDLLDGDGVELLAVQQVGESLHEELAGAEDARVCGFLCGFRCGDGLEGFGHRLKKDTPLPAH